MNLIVCKHDGDIVIFCDIKVFEDETNYAAEDVVMVCGNAPGYSAVVMAILYFLFGLQGIW